jgi:hypothetical protein
MIYLINALFCVTLAFAIYNTMFFIVNAVNAAIDGIKDGEGFIDNRHFLLSWSLFIIACFVKSIIL